MPGNQTGIARDALGGSCCRTRGWSLGGWKPYPKAGCLKVSDTKGALPMSTTRGRQRPGLPHQFVLKSFVRKLVKIVETPWTPFLTLIHQILAFLPTLHIQEPFKHRKVSCRRDNLESKTFRKYFTNNKGIRYTTTAEFSRSGDLIMTQYYYLTCKTLFKYCQLFQVGLL